MSDRRRLAPDGQANALRCLLRQVQWAVDAGIDIVQIRERDLPTRELVALVSESVEIAHGSSTRVIVNDRLDVALACGAAGVHLRTDSVPPDAVRPQVPPGFLVGRSVHDATEAMAVAPFVDYLIAGTVWASDSKAPHPSLLGVEGLRQVVGAVAVPVLAIGGVGLERCSDVARTGAAGVAAIGLFLGPPPMPPQRCRAVSLTGIVKAARAAFGTTRYH